MLHDDTYCNPCTRKYTFAKLGVLELKYFMKCSRGLRFSKMKNNISISNLLQQK